MKLINLSKDRTEITIKLKILISMKEFKINFELKSLFKNFIKYTEIAILAATINTAETSKLIKPVIINRSGITAVMTEPAVIRILSE